MKLEQLKNLTYAFKLLNSAAFDQAPVPLEKHIADALSQR
jgi:hypothetical protein